MVRYVVLVALLVLPLSCASGGSTAEEVPDPQPTPPPEAGQHTVVYSVECGLFGGLTNACWTAVNPKPSMFRYEQRGDTTLAGTAEYTTTCNHGQVVGLELSRGLAAENDGRVRGSISIDGRVVAKGQRAFVKGETGPRLVLRATCE